LEKNTHLEGKHPLVEKTPTRRKNTQLEGNTYLRESAENTHLE
jgi:hypothetical protein